MKSFTAVVRKVLFSLQAKAQISEKLKKLRTTIYNSLDRKLASLFHKELE